MLHNIQKLFGYIKNLTRYETADKSIRTTEMEDINTISDVSRNITEHEIPSQEDKSQASNLKITPESSGQNNAITDIIVCGSIIGIITQPPSNVDDIFKDCITEMEKISTDFTTISDVGSDYTIDVDDISKDQLTDTNIIHIDVTTLNDVFPNLTTNVDNISKALLPEMESNSTDFTNLTDVATNYITDMDGISKDQFTGMENTFTDFVATSFSTDLNNFTTEDKTYSKNNCDNITFNTEDIFNDLNIIMSEEGHPMVSEKNSGEVPVNYYNTDMREDSMWIDNMVENILKHCVINDEDISNHSKTVLKEVPVCYNSEMVVNPFGKKTSQEDHTKTEYGLSSDTASDVEIPDLENLAWSLLCQAFNFSDIEDILKNKSDDAIVIDPYSMENVDLTNVNEDEIPKTEKNENDGVHNKDEELNMKENSLGSTSDIAESYIATEELSTLRRSKSIMKSKSKQITKKRNVGRNPNINLKSTIKMSKMPDMNNLESSVSDITDDTASELNWIFSDEFEDDVDEVHERLSSKFSLFSLKKGNKNSPRAKAKENKLSLISSKQRTKAAHTSFDPASVPKAKKPRLHLFVAKK